MFIFKLSFKLILLALAAVAAGVLWQKGQLTVLALSHLDPVPETRVLVAEERYAEAADYLDFFLGYDYVKQDAAAQALHDEIEARRSELSYWISKLAEAITRGKSDEPMGLIVVVLTDLLVIGDIRDLWEQALNWFEDDPVDEVIVALSTIGAVASAASIASAPLKGGLSTMKILRKLGKLPPWLGKAMIEGAESVKRTGKLDGLADLFNDVYRLGKTRGGVHLLSTTTDAASLRRMANLADTFGDQTATLYRIGGKTFVEVAQRTGALGVDPIKQAATYGRSGLQALDKLGATRFAKYAARGSKIAYKGDIVQLLAGILARIPDWLLYCFVACGASVWMPWRGLRRIMTTKR